MRCISRNGSIFLLIAGWVLGVGAASGQQIIDNGDLANRVFTIDDVSFPGHHSITLTNDATTAGSCIITVSGPPAVQTISFPNPTATLQVEAGDGNNVIRFERLDPAFAADTEILGEEGADTFYVEETPTGTVVVVRGGDGNDVVSVGERANQLDGVRGGGLVLTGDGNDASPEATLIIKGATNSLPIGDTVVFNDENHASGHVYTFSNTDLVRGGLLSIRTSGFETLVLEASEGSGTNEIYLVDSLDSVNMDIRCGPASDRITVNDSQINVNLNITTGAGADELLFTTDGVFGSFVRALMGSGADKLDVSDFGDNSRIEVDGGGQADDFLVSGFSGSSLINLLGGTGGDSFLVDDNDQTVTTIRGEICIDGEGGNNTLTYSDVANGAGADYTMAAGFLEETFGFGTITNFSMTFTNTSLTLNMGSGGDTFEVADTHAGNLMVNLNDGDDVWIATNMSTSAALVFGGNGVDDLRVAGSSNPVTLDGGNNSDTFTIGDPVNDLGNIQGAVTLVGGAEDAAFQVTVKSNSLPRGDRLVIQDQAETTARMFLIGATNIIRGGAAGIGYGGIESIELFAGSGADGITVGPMPARNTTISAGAGDDDVTVSGITSLANTIINGEAGDDTIVVEGSGALSATLIDGGADNDTIELGSAAGSMGSLAGDLCVDGGGENSTPTISAKGNTLPRGDVLELHDEGDASIRTWNLVTDVERSGIPAIERLDIETTRVMTGLNGSIVTNFTATFANSLIIGGAGPDQITLSAAANANTLVSAGGGEDTIDVRETGSGSGSLIEGGEGNDTVLFGAVFGILQDYDGEVGLFGDGNDPAPLFTLNGNAQPRGDVLVFSDQGSGSLATNVVITPGTFDHNRNAPFTHTGFETLEYQGTAGFCTYEVTTDNSFNFVLQAGGGIDMVTVKGTGAGANTQIKGGGGPDVLQVEATGSGSETELEGEGHNDTLIVGAGSGGLVAIQGNVRTDGGSELAGVFNNQTVFAPGGSVSVSVPFGDTVRFDDSGNSMPSAVSLTDTGLTHDGTSATLSYTMAEILEYRGGSASNAISSGVGTPDFTVDISGGAAQDTITVLETGANSLTLANGGGGPDEVLVSISGATTGTVIRLSGGAGGDLLRVVTNAPLTGIYVDGEGGPDVITIENPAADSIFDLYGGSEDDTIEVIGLLDASGVRSHGNDGNDFTVLRRLTSDSEAEFWGDAGNDTFRLGSTDDNASVVDDIEGDISLFGGVHDALPLATASVTALTQVASISFPEGDVLEVYDAGSVGAKDYQYNGSAVLLGVTSLAGMSGGDVETFRIRTGPAANFHDVSGLGPNQQLVLTAGSGVDEITVGSIDTNVIVIVDAGDGDDTILIRDQANQAAVIVDAGPGADDIAQILTVSPDLDGSIMSLNGGLGADTNTILVTGQGSTLWVNGGGGDDEIVLREVDTNTVAELRGGGGNDTFEVLIFPNNLTDLAGSLGVVGGPNLSTPTVTNKSVVLPVGDTLVLNDSNLSGDDNYLLDGTNLAVVGGGSMQIESLETLDLQTGSGVNHFEIQDLLPGLNAMIDLGGGSDTAVIASVRSGTMLTILESFGAGRFFIEEAPAGSVIQIFGEEDVDRVDLGNATNTTDGLQGEVCFDGGTGEDGGGGDTLVIDEVVRKVGHDDNLTIHDQAFAGVGTYLKTTGRVERVGGWSVDHSFIESVDLNGGPSANQYIVEGTVLMGTIPSQRIAYRMFGGTAADFFDIDYTNVSNNNETIVCYAGGNGEDGFRVGNTGQSNFILLSGTPGDNDFTFEDNPALNNALKMDLVGFGGADSFFITPQLGQFSRGINVDGGDPSVAPGDTLYVDAVGHPGQFDNGLFIFTPDYGDVNYTHIENIVFQTGEIADLAMGTNVEVSVTGMEHWDVTPEYSTNLTAVPQVWTPVPLFAADWISGTNIVSFDIIDPGATQLFYRATVEK